MQHYHQQHQLSKLHISPPNSPRQQILSQNHYQQHQQNNNNNKMVTTSLSSMTIDTTTRPTKDFPSFHYNYHQNIKNDSKPLLNNNNLMLTINNNITNSTNNCLNSSEDDENKLTTAESLLFDWQDFFPLETPPPLPDFNPLFDQNEQLCFDMFLNLVSEPTNTINSTGNTSSNDLLFQQQSQSNQAALANTAASLSSTTASSMQVEAVNPNSLLSNPLSFIHKTTASKHINIPFGNKNYYSSSTNSHSLTTNSNHMYNGNNHQQQTHSPNNFSIPTSGSSLTFPSLSSSSSGFSIFNNNNNIEQKRTIVDRTLAKNSSLYPNAFNSTSPHYQNQILSQSMPIISNLNSLKDHYPHRNSIYPRKALCSSENLTPTLSKSFVGSTGMSSGSMMSKIGISFEKPTNSTTLSMTRKNQSNLSTGNSSSGTAQDSNIHPHTMSNTFSMKTSISGETQSVYSTPSCLTSSTSTTTSTPNIKPSTIKTESFNQANKFDLDYISVGGDVDDKNNYNNVNTSNKRQRQKKELLSEEQKRANHIASEKKRRKNIKKGFDTLQISVPGCTGTGHSNSKSNVLFKTADFIRQMDKENHILTKFVKLLESKYHLKSLSASQ